MSKEVFFEGDAEVLPFTTPTTPTTTLQKPSDSLDVPAAAPSTIWYLSITKPHVDSHDIIGPTKAFRHLLPRIEAIVSNSPTAIDKLAQLKETEDMWGETEPNEHFFNNGFEVFIVEGQRGSYTILKMIREINKSLIFFPRQCTRYFPLDPLSTLLCRSKPNHHHHHLLLLLPQHQPRNPLQHRFRQSSPRGSQKAMQLRHSSMAHSSSEQPLGKQQNTS
jgi:hypothetical protein